MSSGVVRVRRTELVRPRTRRSGKTRLVTPPKRRAMSLSYPEAYREQVADSAAAAETPRIERMTLWAMALDAVALIGLFAFAADLLVSETYEEEDIFVIYYRSVAPLAMIAALGLSIRSALTARGPAARVVAWSMAFVTGALLLGWVWGLHELLSPPGINLHIQGCNC